MTEHVHDDVVAFALGDLTQQEASRVMRHVDQCQACANALAEMMTALSALSAAEGERPLSSGLLRTARSARPRFSVGSWFAGLATAAALAFAWWGLGLGPHVDQPTVPISAMVNDHFYEVSLLGALGRAKVLEARDGSWCYLVADALQARKRYELWEIRHGRPVALGPFSTDIAGRATGYWHEAGGPSEGFIVAEFGVDPRRDARALRSL